MFEIKNKSISIHSDNSKGFTLAETLITLVIIGIVAALTLPTMINNHRKEVVATKLKSAYSILSNMFKSAEADYGTMGTWDLSEYSKEISPDSSIDDGFLEKYVLPYLKISSDKTQSLEQFGYKKILYPNGNNASPVLTTPRRIITLNNGMSFWARSGGANLNSGNMVMLQIDFFVDIDGPKYGANTIGKDIFLFSQPFVKGQPLTLAGEQAYAMCLLNGNLSSDIIQKVFSKTNCTYLVSKNTGAIAFSGRKQSREVLLENCKQGTHFSEQCGALIRIDSWRVADDYPWL